MEEWRNWISEHKHSIGIGVLTVQFLIIILFTGKWVMASYMHSSNNEIDSNILAGNSFIQSSEISATEEGDNNEETVQKWIVDIKGEIQFPGIYEVEKEMRINDVIYMAGGLSTNADIRSLNLAQHVQDQMVIYIFSSNERSSELEGEMLAIQVPVVEENKNGLINLNTADSLELQQLSGIGEKKAEKIINYREENGKFQKIEELMDVNGIGEKTFETLKDKVTVSP